jgi:NAD(P)H-dependent FMN reductase
MFFKSFWKNLKPETRSKRKMLEDDFFSNFHIIVFTMTVLKTVLFVGSARNITPPWGGDKRLGDRVLGWVKQTLASRTRTLGADDIKHEVTVVDPLIVFDQKDGALKFSGGELQAPTYFMKSDDLPPKTKELMETIRAADCYLIVSPEYNHSVPPALSSIMGHFGGSLYKCKPSGIITYSNGPFAGMRAAISIQVMCHELGCLPVSKLCGVPAVSDILEKDGTPKDPSHRMLKQLPDLMDQLEWMAVAMKNQRDTTGTF